MSFLKKYSILLIPAGAVLLAAVLVALTALTNRLLAADMQKNSVTPAGQIANLLPKAVSVHQWEAEKGKMDAFEQQVKGVLQLAVGTSRRELISQLVFNQGQAGSQQVYDEYKQLYRRAIEALIGRMNAMEAPSEMEIGSEIGEKWTPGTGTDYSRPYTSGWRGQTDATRRALIDALCAKRADQVTLYANPMVFKWYEYWGEFKFAGREGAVEDCWFSQTAYWIYEDVVSTIAALNGSSKVRTSPIKRLLGVSFMQEATYPTAASRTALGMYQDDVYSGARGDTPEYILKPEGGVLGVAPWTGRVCNEEIDVVHFSVSVITASSAVMPFMKELCSAKEHTWKENGVEQTGQHNQITILKSQVMPVDLSAPENMAYRYGDQAVVRVSLVCEYLFNRAAYDAIQPESVKKRIGRSKDSSATDTQTQMGGYGSAYTSSGPAPASSKRSSGSASRDVGGDF